MGRRSYINDYRIVTVWRLQANVEEVYDILEDVESLARWCPSVYRHVEVLEPGDDHGIGKRVRLLTKGFLPYRLRWAYTVVESERPYGFVLVAEGDFVGRGEWILHQEGSTAVATYDWHVRAEKPLLRRLSFLLKPLFRSNHRWAMRRGEAALRQEIARRRARERSAAVAAPTTSSMF